MKKLYAFCGKLPSSKACLRQAAAMGLCAGIVVLVACPGLVGAQAPSVASSADRPLRVVIVGALQESKSATPVVAPAPTQSRQYAQVAAAAEETPRRQSTEEKAVTRVQFLTAALNNRTNMLVESSGVAAVTRAISDETGIPIVMDQTVLGLPAVRSRWVVDYIHLENVPLKDALKAVLRSVGLDYKVTPYYLWVSTPDRLRHESVGALKTRYYVLGGATFPGRLPLLHASEPTSRGTTAGADSVTITGNILDRINVQGGF